MMLDRIRAIVPVLGSELHKGQCGKKMGSCGPIIGCAMEASVSSTEKPVHFLRDCSILGKLGIIGGCYEYTGAPYYAGVAGLKMVRYGPR